MELAPIVLFVYNRPWHTRQTLSALSKNPLAKESILYIFADGPKENANAEELIKISQVHELLKEIEWCKEVRIKKSDINKGLAKSIVLGVNEVVNRHGKVIVLEDDIVTSPQFLSFMNRSLEIYDDSEQVMAISGYWFPVRNYKRLPSTFFLQVPTCWGWATWKRSWLTFNSNADKLYQEITRDEHLVIQFNFEHGDYANQLKRNISGELNTWAVKWYASVFLSKGLCLHPNWSYVQNIGNDGSGIHSGDSDIFHWKSLNNLTGDIKKIPLVISPQGHQSLSRFYKKYSHQSQLQWFFYYYKKRSLYYLEKGIKFLKTKTLLGIRKLQKF